MRTMMTATTNWHTLPKTSTSDQKRERAVEIQMVYHGAVVSYSFEASIAPTVHEIEQSIDTLLRREGWSGVTPPSAPVLLPAGREKAEYVDPVYDGDGEACCPVHRTPISQGRYGWYCSQRATGAQAANAKGYCALRFKN
jgi:hypothetical protein